MERPNLVFDPNNLYALIIGINDYPLRQTWRSLNGAVADANNFKDYLTSPAHLNVPEDHVCVMLNSKRRDIISAFRELKEGRLHTGGGTKEIDLPHLSAFVLFYAGHGGRTAIPDSNEWNDYHTPDNGVEQLVPSDIGMRDESGEEIQGIPDRTIAAVLKGLVENIGDNVVSLAAE